MLVWGGCSLDTLLHHQLYVDRWQDVAAPNDVYPVLQVKQVIGQQPHIVGNILQSRYTNVNPYAAGG